MPSDPSATFLALQAVLAGRYALERELGRGGMGVVFLARDISLDRPVAIKLLAPALAALPEFRDRFLREARTAARLAHPHIVSIHAVEEHGEQVLFVMGYVEGETLGQRIVRQGPLFPDEVTRILQEVAWALAYAHQHGVIHRDVKPDNILLERASGRALVTDFGIAQVAGAPPAAGDSQVVGTVRYMSPEQLSGQPLNGRSDLFALAATAVHALTGRPPFEGSAGALHGLVRRESVAPLATWGPEVPRQLGAIVDRCLALDPSDRFPDGEALAEALGAARGPQAAVAAPVGRFVELYKTTATEIASYAAVDVVLAVELLIVGGSSLQGAILAVILAWAFFGTVGLAGLRFFQVVRASRRLLEEGYNIADVRRALDRPAEPARGSGTSGRLRGPVVLLGGLLAAGLWVVAFKWQITFTLGAVLDGLIMALFTLIPVVLIRSGFARMLRPGQRGWWSRFWWKVMEWKVFRLARMGGAPASIPASEPTEVALGAGARELFDGLPAELRNRFDEVPAVLERLERQAARLRTEAIPDAQERLGSTLGTMEQLRLDLLTLHAGASPGDLTGDLDAARRVSDRIGALLAARDELE